MSAASSELINGNSEIIREELIQTAVKFLQNPQVVNTSLAKKQKFLQRKGLTDKEVQHACERAGAYLLHEEQTRILPPSANHNVPYSFQSPTVAQVSLFDRIKDVLHNMALLSAVVYAVYMFYKKFIKPFLFGEKKKKSIEDSLEDINKSVHTSINELKDDLQSVRVEVDKMNHSSETSTHRQLQSLQSEISTVKGLLLNRKQFPSVSNTPVVPPSIPAWQMSSEPHESEGDADPKSEELMEIGSGSGSSDPEHATQKSDSSLEIM